ncbi:glycosyl transferase [Azospirillum sp. sgz302134]
MPDRPALHVLVPEGRSPGAYGPRMVAALREARWSVAGRPLPGPYPRVDQSAILAADIAVSRLPDGAAVLVDGLALPGVAGALSVDNRRLKLVALVDQPLWRDPALGTGEAAALRHLEQGALALMRGIAVPTEDVAAELRALGLAAGRIVAAPPDAGGVERLTSLFGA